MPENTQYNGLKLILNFGEFKTHVYTSCEIPSLEKIASDLNLSCIKPLVIADENTAAIAAKICGSLEVFTCVLESGEANKNWQAVEAILARAHSAELGRDSIFLGIGGGVIGDLSGFAASVYMRGCRLALVSTTLLGMVDASVGGKTGFDMFGIKNLVGSFYPAEAVYMPVDCLGTLPEKEWRSGLAELIKTAVLEGDNFLDELSSFSWEAAVKPACGDYYSSERFLRPNVLCKLIERAVLYKGGIVSEDLRESGQRKLLNLGHTFGHALEAAAGLGKISHGEAVAWGIIRSCELGLALGITPMTRAQKIRDLIFSFGYNCESPHPLAANTDILFEAMTSDKKKKNGKLTFIVPDGKSACPVVIETENEIKTVKKIIKGEFNL